MGKVRRKRTKLHAPATGQTTQVSEEKTSSPTDSAVKPTFKLPDRVFSKADIDLDSLQRQLGLGDQRDTDVRSGITSKSMRGLNLKKKDKRQLRKQFWNKKVEVLQAVKKEAKDKKRRQKTAIVGDMKPLQDTLPTLDLLLKETSSRQSQPEETISKPKSIKRSQARQKQMLNDISVFNQVLEHPEFKANPLSTISVHLRNKLKQEEDMDT